MCGDESVQNIEPVGSGESIYRKGGGGVGGAGIGLRLGNGLPQSSAISQIYLGSGGWRRVEIVPMFGGVGVRTFWFW